MINTDKQRELLDQAPPWVQYCAIDQMGAVNGFEKRPRLDDDEWVDKDPLNGHRAIRLGKLPWPADPSRTLISR